MNKYGNDAFLDKDEEDCDGSSVSEMDWHEKIDSAKVKLMKQLLTWLEKRKIIAAVFYFK